MKSRYFCLMIAFLASLVISPSADAGTQDGAVFALHAKAHTTKAATVCTTWKPTIDCSQYKTQWPVHSNTDVYLVIAHVPNATLGIAGASCGIDYAAAPLVGVDAFSWTLCADMEYPSAGANGEWPAAGGGNRIEWFADTNCQRTVIGSYGVHAVAGAFYLYAYSEDVFRVTRNMTTATPELVVVDCSGSATNAWMVCWSPTGSVGFGEGYGYSGCNPCIDPCLLCSPVERSTWGAIKRAY